MWVGKSWKEKQKDLSHIEKINEIELVYEKITSW